jgi:hypothetical protein
MGNYIVNARVKSRRHAIVFALVFLAAGLALVDGGVLPANAVVTAVKGEACSYSVKVGLFGGPQTVNGCNEGSGTNNTGTPRPPGPNVPATTDASYSPHVAISGAGGTMSATDANGAKAVYGPAVIHGGLWPCEDKGTDTVGGVQDDNVTGNCPASGPSSGPQAATTDGSATSGTVTASADISLFTTAAPVSCFSGWGPNPPSTAGCLNYGGFGPFPVSGNSLHVECSATESSVTGTTHFEHATLATATDIEGNPVNEEPVPDNPPVNYTRHGVITNVGDVFTVVYNQQIVNPDGSLTVIGTHMYLYGPTAVGEVVRGQVTCGTTPTSVTPTDTVAPTCGVPVVAPEGPEDPTPKVPAQVLIGMFDAGGLESISSPVVTNGSVQVGKTTPNDDGSPPLPYLQFSAGQTGPLPIIATRANESQTMTFSFVATDKAGNDTTVTVNVPNVNGKATPNATCDSADPGGTTTTTGGSGTTTTTGGSGTTTTTTGGSGSTTTTTGGSGTTTTTGGSGTTTTTAPSADITITPSKVAPGGTIQVTSKGWMPDDNVTAVIHSDPVNLGTVQASAVGALSGSFTVPSSMALGAHTFELSGIGADGEDRVVTASLTVAAETSGGGSSTGGGSTSSGSDAGGAVQGSALSRTGFNLQPFASLAAVSLLIGAVLVAAARRRRLSHRR